LAWALTLSTLGSLWNLLPRTALADAGLDFALGERTAAGASYTGQLAHHVHDTRIEGHFKWLF
jgi:hypothetical protein